MRNAKRSRSFNHLLGAPTVLLLALVFGIVLGGVLHPSFQDDSWVRTLIIGFADPIGKIFLRLVFMVVVPMVFCGLCLGVFELGSHRDLGVVMRRTFSWAIVTSVLSVLIGVGLVNLVQPGRYVKLELTENRTAEISQVQSSAKKAKSVGESLVELVPANPIQAAANALEGEMLAFMVFTVLFGLGLCSVHGKHDSPPEVVAVLESSFQACLWLIGRVMRFAPIAVFALILASVTRHGFELIFSLGLYVAVVLVALAIQQFGVYSALLRGFAKTSPTAFYRKSRDVLLYAFATSSSNATLPQALHLAENGLGLPRKISRFVLTVGSTANQNGTALFEGVTVLFLAQVYGVELGLLEQVQVVLMSILAGIGTAGVPGGSLPLIAVLLGQVGVPVEAIGIVLGVDRILDMCRTTVNVAGDLVIAAIVSESEVASKPIS